MKKILPGFSNQILFTIISDILIVLIILGSLFSSQRLQQQLSHSLLQGSQQQEFEVNTLFNKFLFINLFTILVSTGMFMYLIIKNSKELTQTNKRLESLDKLKDEFLSLASHQLKTPATGVKAYLSMLLDGDAGKLTKSQKEFTKEAYEANERELRMVEDLLNVSRIESGRLFLDRSEIELNKLINDVSGELRKLIEDQNIVLSITSTDPQILLEGDMDKLKMVFGNLLDNARKYTNEGGSINVSIEKESGFVKVTVSDTGIGIAKENMDKLFRKFTRIDSRRSREISGTGLGLYIVKKIIELHKGTITVESAVGRGSKFVVTLPLRT